MTPTKQLITGFFYASLSTTIGGMTVALTRLTEDLGGFSNDKIKEAMNPAAVSPLLVYLASSLSGDMTGKTFLAGGGRIAEMRVVTHTGITKKVDDGLWTADQIAAQMQAGEILLPD